MLSVTRAAEHGITHHGPTKKATAAYVDLLQQLQAGSRKYAAARGRLLIAQDVVDRMVEIGERALANGVATPPRLEWQAVELAHGLLVNLGRRPTKVSCLSRWHKVAAAMLGVDNEKVDLRRQMDACLKVARERQK
jgi:hypothetical protein